MTAHSSSNGHSDNSNYKQPAERTHWQRQPRSKGRFGSFTDEMPIETTDATDDGTDESPITERVEDGFGGPRPSLALRDIRWVYKHPKREMRTEARRCLQTLFKEDLNGFLKLMREEEHCYEKAKNEFRVAQARALKCGTSRNQAKPKASDQAGTADESAVKDEGAERMSSVLVEYLKKLADDANRAADEDDERLKKARPQLKSETQARGDSSGMSSQRQADGAQ